ncbi:MAG: hypothetical protein LUC27_01200 [Lachnospiraceae bacterium]|nr:hypothetical protein [Lachnospiraceae bacterium]
MKKKLACFLCFSMIFLLSACGSNSESVSDANTESAEEASTESVMEETTESIEDESTDIDLFDDVFVELADQIDVMTFEECELYFENIALDVEKTEPSDEETGRITAADQENEYGFELIIDFFLNEDDKETITLISYTNGNFEGSVSDNAHTSSITYGIYDITAETRNVDVDSLEDVMEFINEEVPGKILEYDTLVSGNTEIDVTLDVESDNSSGAVYFTVNTNLPDDTVLMFKLTNDDDYTAQSKVSVVGGVATSEGFSKNGENLSGHFTLTISTPLAKTQPESVMEIIGSEGEFLQGCM